MNNSDLCLNGAECNTAVVYGGSLGVIGVTATLINQR